MADRLSAVRDTGVQLVCLGRAACAALRDILTGAIGSNAYGNYVLHLRARHPDRTPLSREAFFRQDQRARWEGVRRCC